MIAAVLIFCLFSVAFFAFLLAVRVRVNVKQLQRRLESQSATGQMQRQQMGRLEFGLSALQAQVTRHENASGGFWTTGNGTVLRIRDMSWEHIKQSIEWCRERKRDTTDLRAELCRRRRNNRLA